MRQVWLVVWALACRRGGPGDAGSVDSLSDSAPPSATADTASAHSGTTGHDTAGSSTGDTGDTGTSPGPGPGVVVLAGGGSEGEVGDPTAWSARLYGALLEGGDVTGDGLVRVVVLSTARETEWLPEYLVWLGADEATNLRVADRTDADAVVVADWDAVDAVFVKGGDQGEYYDLWNDTRLEEVVRGVKARGGGVGGTSAGAMSMAGFAFAGGEDLVSADVLADAQTEYLDDRSDGGSGIHDDFLGLVPDVVVDTHFTVRGRLGRLCGILARVVDESGPPELLGIGLDERTGVVVRGTTAEVIGDGAVTLVDPSTAAAPLRPDGRPLVWTGLTLTRLTEGFAFDLATPHAPSLPAHAEVVAWSGSSGPTDGVWYADGDRRDHEERFAIVVDRGPVPFATRAGRDEPVLADAIGLMDAHASDVRGANEEALFRALHDHVGHTGFLVGHGGSLERQVSDPARIAAVDNPATSSPPLATLVVDTTAVTWRALAAAPSPSDGGDGSLVAGALVGMRLHVLYTPVGGSTYDTVLRAVQ